jgi:N-acetyl-gamma-glutamyl-phosphate reductase
LHQYALSVHKIPVGVLGASGYAGRELCALIAGHPGLSLAFATANQQRGETLRLPTGDTVTFQATDDAPLGDVALVFCALPHGASLSWVARARQAGAKVVDLSHDLRAGRAERLAATKEAAHDELMTPELAAAPFGFPELHREAIAAASVVANPGCYATAILAGLAPLVANGLIAPGATVSVAAASGVSGAGITPRIDLLFGEVTENYSAYATANAHRHLHEVRATLQAVARQASRAHVAMMPGVVAGHIGPAVAERLPHADVDILFTPHLLPVARGILATMTVPLVEPLTDPLAPFMAMYAGEPFVEVVGSAPMLKDVQRRNVVRIAPITPSGVRQPTLQLFTALDNLVKGAAGQAVQNANLMLGLPETDGLPR